MFWVICIKRIVSNRKVCFRYDWITCRKYIYWGWEWQTGTRKSIWTPRKLICTYFLFSYFTCTKYKTNFSPSFWNFPPSPSLSGIHMHITFFILVFSDTVIHSYMNLTFLINWCLSLVSHIYGYELLSMVKQFHLFFSMLKWRLLAAALWHWACTTSSDPFFRTEKAPLPTIQYNPPLYDPSSSLPRGSRAVYYTNPGVLSFS